MIDITCPNTDPVRWQWCEWWQWVTHGDNVASLCPSAAGCTTKSQSQSLASSEAGELGLGQSLTQATVCRTRHLASTPSTRPEPQPGHGILASDRCRQNIGVYYLIDMKQLKKPLSTMLVIIYSLKDLKCHISRAPCKSTWGLQIKVKRKTMARRLHAARKRMSRA